jgi:methylated-DNA-[protein]-cysteine S-methyltransferase
VSVTPISYEAEGWGIGEVWMRGETLVWHELPRPWSGSSGTRARVRQTPSQGGEAFPPPSRSRLPRKRTRGGDGFVPKADQLIHRIKGYFAGDRISFDDVPLELDGWTPFQLAILQALRRVRYGEVVSYSDLARLAGYPRAQRAAGTFCARNRFSLVVPCHRVIGANGLGSYGSLGLDYKRRLLTLEGVAV